MIKHYTDKKLKELLQLQKEHLSDLLKYFNKNVTEEEIDKVIGIISVGINYRELHLESVNRKLDKSLTPELKKKLDDNS